METTDRGFSFASNDGPFADFVRTKIAPIVLPAAAYFHAFRELAFRTVSQTLINYRAMALAEGKAGKVSGGDRLPWIKGSRNYDSLGQMIWQVHVYGEAKPGIRQWCEQNKVLLTMFVWDAAYGEAGLKQDAVYLIRPDTYVAMADEKALPQNLENYFASRKLTP